MIIAPVRVTAPGNRTRLTFFSSHLFSADLRRHTFGNVPFFSSGDCLMPDTIESPALIWGRIVNALKQEVSDLPCSERHWISEKLVRLGALQEKMHALFLSADGMRLCSSCFGQCCGCGKNHLTLANLLAFLLHDEEPPTPDFTRTCPYLGDGGCLFAAARRPYNCVSFLCEALEDRLAPELQSEFYALERELRAIYLEFDDRYAGSSLRGIFIRAERLAGTPFLERT
jgi:hypothetical protein